MNRSKHLSSSFSMAFLSPLLSSSWIATGFHLWGMMAATRFARSLSFGALDLEGDVTEEKGKKHKVTIIT